MNSLGYRFNKSLFTFVLLLISLFVSGCDSSSEGCVYADEFGDMTRTEFSIPARDESQCTVIQGGTNSDFLTKCLDGTTTATLISFSESYDFTLSNGKKVELKSGGGCDELLKATIDPSKVSVTNADGTVGSLATNTEKGEAFDFCANLCENECNSSSDIDFEPIWTALGDYVDDTMMPENKASIEMVVERSVILKDKKESKFTVPANSYDYVHRSFDKGLQFDLYLSGSWDNGGVSYDTSENNFDKFAKSLIVSIENRPSNYDSNNSEPSFDLWSCTYSGIDEYKESSCLSSQAQGAFPISSAKKGEGLGSYGGMVRWAGEKMHYPDYDNVLCSSSSDTVSCSDQDNSALGDFILDSSVKSFSVTDLESSELYGVSFKLLGDDVASFASEATSEVNAGSCSINVQVTKKDGTIIKSDTSVSPLSGNWTYVESMVDSGLTPIKLPFFTPGDVNDVTVSTSGTWRRVDGGVDIQCSAGNLAVRFDKVKKIKFENSGLVGFKGLSGANISSCDIKTNIINPTNLLGDGDYLEFSTPFTTVVGDSSWSSSSSLFVRKGQELLFYPSSWSGYRDVYASDSSILDRECGIGMAMKVEVRPAIFCDSNVQSYNLSGECLMGVDSQGQPTGWCDSSPIKSCISSDNICTVGTHEELEAGGDYNCGIVCADSDSTCLNECRTRCSTCKTHIDDIKAKKVIPFTSTVIANRICYNLESYTGRKSDLQTTSSLPSFPSKDADGVYSDVSDLKEYYSDIQNQGGLSDGNVEKGAKLLSAISNSVDNIGYIGDIGTFIPVYDDGGNAKVDSNGNQLFELVNDINIESDSLVKFFVYDIDENYTNNSGYGYNILLNMDEPYVNGDMLEVKACYDSNGLSKCALGQSATIQKDIVLADGSKSNFFDESGRLGSDSVVGKYIFDKASFCKEKYVEGSDEFDDCKGDIDLYFKIKDPDSTDKPYNNNEGFYAADVVVKNAEAGMITSFAAGVIDSLIQEIEVYIERMYNNIISNQTYQNLLNLSLVLFVMFYGLNFLMGTSKLTQTELLNRLIKIAFIYLFVSPNGWKFYEAYFVNLFRGGVDYIVFSLSAIFGNEAIIGEIGKEVPSRALMFNGIDETLGLVFNSSSLSKIFGLFFSSLTGWISCCILVFSIFMFVFAVANAILLYTIAQLFTIILLILGPIFFVTLLFENTKGMFDKWLKSLIGFAMQQIVLLTAISLFFVLFRELIKVNLGYTVCVGDIWTLTVPFVEQKFSMIRGYTIPKVNGADMLYSPSAPSLLKMVSLCLVASLMKKYVNFSSSMGEKIADTPLDTSSLAKGISAAAGGVWDKKGDYAASAVDGALKYGVGGVASLVGRGDIGSKLVNFRQEHLSPGNYIDKAKKFALGKTLSTEEEKQKYDTLRLKKSVKESVGKKYEEKMQELNSKFMKKKISADDYLKESEGLGEKLFNEEVKERKLSGDQIEAIKSDTDITDVNMGVGTYLMSKGAVAGFDGSEFYKGVLNNALGDKGIFNANPERQLVYAELRNLGSGGFLNLKQKGALFDRYSSKYNYEIVKNKKGEYIRVLKSHIKKQTLNNARHNFVKYEDRIKHYHDIKEAIKLGKSLRAAEKSGAEPEEIEVKRNKLFEAEVQVRRNAELGGLMTKESMRLITSGEYEKAEENNSEFGKKIDSDYEKALNVMHNRREDAELEERHLDFYKRQDYTGNN